MTITCMISHGNYNFRDERNNTKKEYAISGFPSNKNILTKIGQRKLSFPVSRIYRSSERNAT